MPKSQPHLSSSWKRSTASIALALVATGPAWTAPVEAAGTSASSLSASPRSSGRPAELVRNPRFRLGEQGWSKSGRARGTLVVSRSGRHGSRGAELHAWGPGSMVLRNRAKNAAVQARPGDTLVLTASVRADRPGATGVLVANGRAGRRSTGHGSTPISLFDTRWHRVTTTLTVTRWTSSVAIRVRIDNAASFGRVYVDDVHLRNPAVTRVRAAGFDRVPLGRIAPSSFMRTLGGQNGNPQTYEDTSVAADSRGHGRVLRTTLEKGTIVSSPSGTNGIIVLPELPRRVDQACLSYQVRFDRRFDWSLGGKLPGLIGVAPGVSPGIASGGRHPGDLGWSGRLMWVGPRAYSWAGPSNMAVSYMYGPRQRDRYGDVLPWGKAFRAGRWHTVMQCYTMNTVGRADGRLEAWIDGKVVLRQTSYVFRTRSDVQVSHVAWSIFRGGNTMDWAGSRNSHIDIDGVLVTTR